MRKPRCITVLLPAYDVAPAMPTVVRDVAVAAYALRVRGIRLEVLVLAGGTDDTATVAKQAAADFKLDLTVVDGPPEGPGDAFLQGFRRVVEAGRADLVATLDSNGRHDASEIPRLVDLLVDGGYDVVIGSRWARGSGTPGLSLSRWILGRLANQAFRTLTGTRGIADATTSFRIARMEVVRDFRFDTVPVNNHSLQTAFIASAVARGYRIAEGPIIYRPAIGGGGGLRSGDVASFAAHLLSLRSEVDRARQQRMSPSGRSFTDENFGAADDLERLGSARHFFEWVLTEFHPYLRGRMLEVGAGVGTITRKLVDGYPNLSVVALEPAENVYGDLAAYAALSPRVVVHRQTLAEFKDAKGFDAVLYLNVLEHIQDDAEEVRRAADALRPGGALLVFGPALEWLYSELDYKAGHYRRYRVDQLRALVAAAGLDLVSVRYFDVLGVLPYFIVYRLLRHRDIAGSTMWGYDRLVVPLSRLLQRAMPHPPMGKNIVLVATKP
jgi:2-polyprenyl-3-methyl-5-hydroxy-6-metoxy-1,4-benzoquinol methylase